MGATSGGKRTLRGQRHPDAVWIDLLKADEFRRHATLPEMLHQELEAAGPESSRHIVIDEIQRAPALLDEVHWQFENRSLSFALCRPSARKVRRRPPAVTP